MVMGGNQVGCWSLKVCALNILYFLFLCLYVSHKSKDLVLFICAFLLINSTYLFVGYTSLLLLRVIGEIQNYGSS